MSDPVASGTWVEIHRIVLEAGERAPQVPPDTARVPLEMRVRGTLVESAAPGDEVSVTTASGRTVRGVLCAVNPPYNHSFGAPLAELLDIREEVRERLRGRKHES
jgi:hypothetical protein